MRVGSTLSDTFGLSWGVPQGSILSTTLFNIKINSIMNCLAPKTDGSLYVDDFCMCYRSTSMRTIERHLQQCINRIENWALKNGFGSGRLYLIRLGFHRVFHKGAYYLLHYLILKSTAS